MKLEIRRILTETNEDKFKNIVKTYFNKLDDTNKVDFKNYLSKYVFFTR